MKNVTILFGSPHKNGNTQKLLRGFLKAFSNCNINHVNAYEINAKPCIDCKYCAKNLKCIFNDLDDLHNFFKSSNILIIAFPIYNHSLPSPLKAIFDRMQRYYNQKLYLKNHPFTQKDALILLTGGSNNSDLEKEIISQIKPNLKLINVKNIKIFTVKVTDNKNFSMEKFLEQNQNNLENIANNLLREVK